MDSILIKRLRSDATLPTRSLEEHKDALERHHAA